MRGLKILCMTLMILFIGSFITNTAAVSDQPPESFQWQLGQKLTYKVKWGFFRLGTLTLEVLDTLEMDEQQVYHVRILIESNPVLIFLDMNSVFDCYIDHRFRPLLYSTNETEDGNSRTSRYSFDYDQQLLHLRIEDEQDSSNSIHKEMHMLPKTYDGISLTMWARANVHRTFEDTVNSFLEDEFGQLTIQFMGKSESIKIDALEDAEPTYFVQGVLMLKGIAGVTGPYRGYFSRDKDRVPLKAYLKVFIGNVVVELEEWEHWQPLSVEP